MRDRKALKRRYVEMVGRRFGSLRVVLVWKSRSGTYKQAFRVACACDCGSYVHTEARRVLDGRNVSCGCAARAAQLGVNSACVRGMSIHKDAAIQRRRASVAALDAMPRPMRPPGR